MVTTTTFSSSRRAHRKKPRRCCHLLTNACRIFPILAFHFSFSILLSSNYFLICDFLRNFFTLFFAISIRIRVLASLNITWITGNNRGTVYSDRFTYYFCSILFVYYFCDYSVTASVLLLLLLLLYCLHIL